MAHRPDDVATQGEHATPELDATTVTVRLADIDPYAGLVAACARLSMALPADVIKTLPDAAVDALSAIQSLLYGFEHAKPEG